MLRNLRKFIADQSGAITVDWVVLTAAIVGLNILVIMQMINNGMFQVMHEVDDKIDEYVEIGGS